MERGDPSSSWLCISRAGREDSEKDPGNKAEVRPPTCQLWDLFWMASQYRLPIG